MKDYSCLERRVGSQIIENSFTACKANNTGVSASTDLMGQVTDHQTHWHKFQWEWHNLVKCLKLSKIRLFCFSIYFFYHNISKENFNNSCIPSKKLQHALSLWPCNYSLVPQVKKKKKKICRNSISYMGSNDRKKLNYYLHRYPL